MEEPKPYLKKSAEKLRVQFSNKEENHVIQILRYSVIARKRACLHIIDEQVENLKAKT